MTVKSDTWIREKSTLPLYVLTISVLNDHKGLMGYEEKYSTQSAEELNAIIAQGTIDNSSGNGKVVTSYRELYKEEKDNFKPLISPFVDRKTSQLENGKKVPSFGLSSYGLGWLLSFWEFLF